MVTTAPGKTMELEGNLKAFQLSDILRFLALGKMSGVLTFSNKENAIELNFKDGALIGTFSPERFPRLGQMLVYNGLITRKGLEEVLEAQRDSQSDKMLGEIMMERGLATQEQIESALRLQIREQLWDLFSWSEGTFKFEHGLRPRMERFMVTLELEPLIEEGYMHLEQWRAINANLGDPDLVFRVTRILDALPEAKLTPAAWRILSLINGRHSLQVLIFLSGLGRFETLCALDRLVALQFVEVIPARHRPIPGGRPEDFATKPSTPAARRAIAAAETSTINDEEEVAESRSRGGLFGLRRRAPRKEPTPDPGAAAASGPARAGSYLTSVGLACAMVSRLAARLCAEPDCRIEGGAPALLAALWDEIGVRFPRADLIAVRQGELDPSAYEAYVKLAGGVSDILAGCHEDSMESLALIGKRLARLGRERLGERARRLVGETVRPFLDGAEIRVAADFMPRAWADQWIEV